MNTLLWVLQAVTAVMYAASGVMKVFMFDRISGDVPSFGALPRRAWTVLGIIELACVCGLILPGLLHGSMTITVVAAAILAVESIVFIWVHVRYREVPPIIMSAVLGVVMLFIAYGRSSLHP